MFYLFAFIDRVQKEKKETLVSSKRVFLVRVIERLLLIAIGLVGVFGLALLLGLYNRQVAFINQSMLAGGAVGVLVSALVIGRPSLFRVR